MTLHPAVVDDSSDFGTHVLPIDNPIDEAVFQQEFAGLESIGKGGLDGGLDDSRPGEPDQGLRLDLSYAGQHHLDAHTRVNHDRHGADLEQAEDQGHELKARLDHDQRSHARLDAFCREATGIPIRFDLKLSESEMGVAAPTTTSAPPGYYDGLLIRPLLSRLCQV